MKEVTIKLYTYAELSEEAKAKALAKYNEVNDDPMLQAHLGNLVKEELDARKIKYDTDSINVLYSLGYSQGDGLMFEGTLYDDHGRTIKITHAGHYYHSHSREIDYPEASEREYSDFEKVYQAVCKKTEKAGYDEVEYQQSEENFREACEANEWTFEADGKMRNA